MIDQACHAAAHLAGLHGLLRGARQTLLPLYLERLALFVAQRWRGGFAATLAIVVVRCLFSTGCLGLHGSGAFTLAPFGLLIQRSIAVLIAIVVPLRIVSASAGLLLGFIGLVGCLALLTAP
jgi:hypothetical protein